MIDFGDGIEVNIENFLHEPCSSFFVGSDAIICVASVFNFIDLSFQEVSNEGGSHVVIFANAEIEELAFWVGSKCCALSSFDFFELVDFGGFPIVCATDTICEKRLKPRICAAHSASDNKKQENMGYGQNARSPYQQDSLVNC